MMKRFLLFTGLFLIILLGVDRAVGLSFKYMANHARGGYLGHQNYILNESKDSILIFGSSRAIHHYNAAMIEDSLGLSCYNCGQDGEGIIMYYGWWQIIKERYNPKYILYEVTTNYDVDIEDNTKHLGWLKGLYDNKAIQQEFDEIDHKEKYKMQSLLYRYNSRFHQVLIDYFHPVHNINKGFLPVYRELDPLQVRENKITDEVKKVKPEIDALKMSYFDKLLNDLGDTRIVFLVSPTWYGRYNESLDVIKDMAEKNDCLFLDFSCDSSFVHQDELFYDGAHMNYRGADLFTQKVIVSLKQIQNL